MSNDLSYKVERIYKLMETICNLYGSHKERIYEIMNDKNISESRRVELHKQADADFLEKEISSTVGYIHQYMTELLNHIDENAIYNPDDQGLNNAMAIVRKQDAPAKVIEDIRNKYVGNDVVMSLLAEESADNWKNYLKDAIFNDQRRFQFQLSINSMSPANYVSVTKQFEPSMLIGALSNAESQVRQYVVLRKVDFDVNKDIVNKVRADLVTARLVEKNKW